MLIFRCSVTLLQSFLQNVGAEGDQRQGINNRYRQRHPDTLGSELLLRLSAAGHCTTRQIRIEQGSEGSGRPEQLSTTCCYQRPGEENSMGKIILLSKGTRLESCNEIVPRSTLLTLQSTFGAERWQSCTLHSPCSPPCSPLQWRRL